MLSIELKTQLYELIKSLGYNVTDNGTYEEKFPWLMVRTSGHNRFDSFDLRTDAFSFTIDIFSTYAGEREILEIIENISNNIQDLRIQNNKIMFISQNSLRIIDDNKKGPVRKHGVVTYRFLCSSGLEEIENEE